MIFKSQETMFPMFPIPFKNPEFLTLFRVRFSLFNPSLTPQAVSLKPIT
jgi:hypothetical protein